MRDEPSSHQGPAPDRPKPMLGAGSDRGSADKATPEKAVGGKPVSHWDNGNTASAHQAGGGDDPSGGHGPKPKRRRRRRKRRSVHAKVPLNGSVADAPADGDATANAKPQPVPKAPKPAPHGAQQPRHRSAASRHGQSNAYAALDLGTNNCRLLVAVPTRPGQFRVIDAFSRIVRLGEGLAATNRLSDAAMDRAVEALKACSRKLQTRPVKRMRLIATEACRSADNGVAFLERVETETGLKLEIVDRKTEARLAVAGCASLVERNTDGLVLFDIGGGSSEIALMDLAQRRGRLTDKIVAWTSLKIGVVTLAERFGGREVTPELFAQMKAYSTDLLNEFAESHRLDHYLGSRHFALLGTSGTVTTLAGIHLGLERYDRRRVDGLWMTAGEVSAINERLLGWSFEERVANACIGADRADLVLAGCAIMEAIRERWPAQRLRVADRGLREGLLTEMMAADGAWRSRNRHRNQRNHKPQHKPQERPS